MSVQAVAYVLEGHPAKGADRLVLLSLANHADGTEWECWPSVDLIAWEANLTTDHVRRSLRAMDQRGWITRVVNAAPDDRIPADRRPNLYRIVGAVEPRVRAERLPVDRARVGDPRGDGWDNDASTGRRGSPTKPSSEPSEEPSEPLAPDGADEVPLFVVADAPEPDRFAEFWSVYPLHRGKVAARKAWDRALRHASAEEIIAGAARYAAERAGQDPAKTKYPQGWLTDGRWDDDAVRSQRARPRQHTNVDQDRSRPTGRVAL